MHIALSICHGTLDKSGFFLLQLLSLPPRDPDRAARDGAKDRHDTTGIEASCDMSSAQPAASPSTQSQPIQSQPEKTQAPYKPDFSDLVKTSGSNFDDAFCPHRDSESLWDFTIANPSSPDWRALPSRASPNTELEYQRAKEIGKLRDYYDSLCKKYLFQLPPDQSFNRWILEQLTILAPNKRDYLLPNPQAACTDVIRRELSKTIPADPYIPYKKRQSPSDLSDLLVNYHKNAKKWLSLFQKEYREGNVQTAGMTRHNIWALEDEFNLCIRHSQSWLHEKQNRTAQELIDKIKSVSKSLSDILEPITSIQIDFVLRELATKSYNSIRGLNNNHFTDKHVPIVSKPDDEPLWSVTYKDDKLFFHQTHWLKLATLYKRNTPEDPNGNLFSTRLYILLRRYQTFFGESSSGKKSCSMHAATLPRAFHYLAKNFGVTQENFASPLNCFFSQFNSAFPDTDQYFGSLGSFFDFKPQSGSFQTGPPYTEEVMAKMALHLDRLMTNSSEPLSFVVFVPDWQDPPSPGLVTMEKSKFLRVDFVLQGKYHQFVVGGQHNVDVSARFWSLPFDTHVYILQNDAGNQKWQPTKTFVEGFLDVLYKPGAPRHLFTYKIKS